MNKRQLKKQLKTILSNYHIGGMVPCIRARALRDAVYFAHEHELDLPIEVEEIPLVKVIRLMIQKESYSTTQKES